MEHLLKTNRQMQAEQTKLQIFEAAIRLLEVKEFDSITVRDIVKEARVSVGSFYNAYPSKLDVFYETYRVADDYFEERVRPSLTEPDAADRVRHFFREYAAYNSEISSFALTKVLYNPNNTWFHRGNGGMRKLLTECIQYGLDRGEFVSDQDAGEICTFLMVCIRGLVYDWCTCDGCYDLKEKMALYVDVLSMPFRNAGSKS